MVGLFCYRCDCGNSKIIMNTCKLTSAKDSINVNNTYNQNNDGLYCVCHRPYPDPDCEEQEEMIQCSVCEDWYHESHLGSSKPPASETYAEMICNTCVSKLPFVKDYYSSLSEVASTTPTSSENVVPTATNASDSNAEDNAVSKKRTLENDDSTSENNPPMETDTAPSDAVVVCTKDKYRRADTLASDSSLFLPEGWRGKLCR